MHDKSRRQLSADMLARKQELINRRLDAQRARINARFEHKQAHLRDKQNVKQDQIIEAALLLLQEGGLDALSLRDIARRLNMQAPALYWYFRNKENLIDLMAEAILQKELHSLKVRADDESWQEWLIGHMSQLRRAMLAYPDGARVVAGAHIYPAITLARSFEYSLASLASAGIELRTAAHIVITATHYTFGHVIEEQASPSADDLAKVDTITLFESYPYMREMIKVMGDPSTGADKNFVIGLEYIIRGATV